MSHAGQAISTQNIRLSGGFEAFIQELGKHLTDLAQMVERYSNAPYQLAKALYERLHDSSVNSAIYGGAKQLAEYRARVDDVIQEFEVSNLSAFVNDVKRGQYFFKKDDQVNEGLMSAGIHISVYDRFLHSERIIKIPSGEEEAYFDKLTQFIDTHLGLSSGTVHSFMRQFGNQGIIGGGARRILQDELLGEDSGYFVSPETPYRITLNNREGKLFVVVGIPEVHIKSMTDGSVQVVDVPMKSVFKASGPAASASDLVYADSEGPGKLQAAMDGLKKPLRMLLTEREPSGVDSIQSVSSAGEMSPRSGSPYSVSSVFGFPEGSNTSSGVFVTIDLSW